MPVVMLKRAIQTPFGRTIRDEDGKPIKRIVFQPGDSVAVDDADMPSLKKDIDLGTLVVSPVLKTVKAEEPEAVQSAEPQPDEPKVEPEARPPHHRRHNR